MLRTKLEGVSWVSLRIPTTRRLLPPGHSPVTRAGVEINVAKTMGLARPDVVITFGPSGISNHDDHITIHKAAVEAFRRYRASADGTPRLFYVAIPKELAKQFKRVLPPGLTPTRSSAGRAPGCRWRITAPAHQSTPP